MKKKKNKLAIAVAAAAGTTALYTISAAAVMFCAGMVRDGDTDRNYDAVRDADIAPPENATEYRKKAWPYNKWLSEQNFEPRHIISRDGLTLEARLLRSEHPIGKLAIVCHGHRCCAGEEGFIVKMFLDAGFHVLAIDQRAHGASEGRLFGMGCTEMYDVQQWCLLAGDEFPECDIVLYGASMGAATVIMANSLSLHPNVKCVIEDCGYTSIYEVFMVKCKSEYKAMPLKELVLDTASILCKAIQGFGYKTNTVLDASAQAKLPMLFIHGTDDTVVPREMAIRLHDACPTDKAYFEVAGAGHNVSYFHAKTDYENTVFGFIDNHC